MKVSQSSIPGVLVIESNILRDFRGEFRKIYHKPSFQELGIVDEFVEDFFSTSGRNIIRGCHFQTPPHSHAKLVSCFAGEVFDVVVDLRDGSPTFLQCESFTLSAENGLSIYIPQGCAHGFAVQGESATVFYKTSTIHNPDHDLGIRWDSIDIDWPVKDPVLSKRDQSFPTLKEFKTPFKF